MRIRLCIAIATTSAALPLIAAGCAPRPLPQEQQQQQQQARQTSSSKDKGAKDLRLPAPPPRVPVAKSVPIDPALREQARQLIRTSFDASDPIERANAIEAAQDTVGAEARDLYEMGLADKESIVRFAAAMAIGKLQLTEMHGAVAALSDDPSPRVQIGVRYALHRMGDWRLSHDLERFAADSNPRIREDAAFVLGRLGEKSAIRILSEMMSDNDVGVRIAVAEAMWRLGDERGLSILVAGTVSQFADDRMLCILALAGPRDSRVEEHIFGKLTDDYPEVSLVAARAMGELGSDAGYGVAANQIKKVDPRIRVLAAIALGKIGRTDAQPLLAPLLNDSDPRVKLAAATALLELKAS